MRGVLAVLALCTGCDYVLRVDRLEDVEADARGVDAAAVPFEFIQSNWRTAVSETSTVVELTSAQQPGNLNVVIAGWASAPAITVTDTNNNVYQVAQTAKTQNSVGQAIYYAENIAGGDNTVVVTYAGEAAMYPDVRVLEYAGAKREGAYLAGSTKAGSGTAMGALPIDVPSAPALLIAGFTVGATTTAAGAGYTERINTDHGDFVMDMVVTTSGTYPANAEQSGATSYIVQLVAFALQ